MLQGMETRQGFLSNGFPVCQFRDSYLNRFIVDQSTIIGDYHDSFMRPGTSALWLRCYSTEEGSGKTGELTSAHLCREQVAGLIEILQRWLDTGCIHENPEQPFHCDSVKPEAGA